MIQVDDFPAISEASERGLLAVGGDLAPRLLLSAYSKGIFPWYNEDQPILWWSPDPRCVLVPERFHRSRSLAKSIRSRGFRFTLDAAFERVIRACAEPSGRRPQTWINQDMIAAYTRLHRLGFAHSVETWKGDCLAGGLYGVAIGRMFFGESMFSSVTDASKAALGFLAAMLDETGYHLIDCQVTSDHLLGLGAEEIPRSEFIVRLERACGRHIRPGEWPGANIGSVL